jgi:hypothetical protein
LPVNESAAPPAAITIVLCAVVVYGTSLESVICAVNVDSPTVVGVPEIVALVALKLSPAGKVPLAMLHLSAPVPPVALSVME